MSASPTIQTVMQNTLPRFRPVAKVSQERYKSEVIVVAGWTVPCEFTWSQSGFTIQSLAGVEASSLRQKEEVLRKHPTVQQAAESFFTLIDSGRRLLVLVPTPGTRPSRWPWKHITKSRNKPALQ
jgi:hypothetical protein